MFELSPGRKVVGAVALALLAVGCGGGGAAPTPAPAFAGDLSQVLTIEVRNERLDATSIFLFIEGSRQRLGDVRGNQTETFHVPLERPSQITMTFNITLGPSCVTRSVVLRPGEEVRVRIPANLNTMEAVCRPR
jgi:hypothetical protein